MPDFRLRKASADLNDRSRFDVLLTLDDGYDLRVGGIARDVGPGPRIFWTWCCSGASGEAATREDAMAAFRMAWRDVTAEAVAEERYRQETTAMKYALWDAGYRGQVAKGAVHCPCGETFDPRIFEQTRAHISDITGRRAGT